MNTLRNRVQLIGNVGNDPQVLELGNGRKLTTFSMATNRSYKDKEGERIEGPKADTVI